MKPGRVPPGWDRFAAELANMARERGFTSARGIYGITVFDKDLRDRLWIAPSGQYMSYYYDTDKNQVSTHHGHGSEGTIRTHLTEWMNLRS